MNNCIKCQAGLSDGTKFCRRCGTEQVIKSDNKAEPDAATSSFNTNELKINQTANAEIINQTDTETVEGGTKYNTNKLTTNSLNPPVSPTMPMTQAFEEKRKRGLLIAGAIFLLMAIFGGAMTYAVVVWLQSLRTNPSPSKSHLPSGRPATVEVITPTPSESPLPRPFETPLETPKPLTTPEVNDVLPTPRFSPLSTPPEVKEKPVVKPTPQPRVELPEGENSNQEGQVTETGVLGVNFKLIGKALVKIRGDEISIIPLAEGSVSGVSRSVINPLPSAPAQVVGRQHSYDPVDVVMVERPLLRNNFTATFEVESRASDFDKAVKVDLSVRWQTLARARKTR